jgi:ribonuclease HI
LSTDGGSRGNPGPAAIGYVLAAADGAVPAAHGEAIGIAGANVAEYRALLSGLEHASSLGLDLVTRAATRAWSSSRSPDIGNRPTRACASCATRSKRLPRASAR